MSMDTEKDNERTSRLKLVIKTISDIKEKDVEKRQNPYYGMSCM